MAHKQDGSIFHKVQLTTFAILFAGYASYTYNRKAVSFALPSLMKSGLLDKSGAGKTQDLILFFFTNVNILKGTIASCQNAAYAISKFLGGIMSDKISAKWLFFSGKKCVTL